MKYFLSLSLLLLTTAVVSAQQSITLEDIWQNYAFSPKRVPGFTFMNDGQHYTRREGGKIVQYNLLSGEQTQVLFDASKVSGAAGFDGNMDSYRFSDDERQILITAGTESIYRHSTRANFYVYDRVARQLRAVYPQGKVRYATLNPAGTKVAFVYNNNLHYTDLATGTVTTVTQDGRENAIINGATDWVYEEEFAIWQGFQWSPDGERIAYLRFDETQVPEFTMPMYNDDLYPEYVTFKYPKVGATNSTVSVHVADISKKKIKTTDVDLGGGEYYVPRFYWTPDPKELLVYKMNRHQNKLELLLVNAKNGKAETLMTEENKYYIDIHDNLTFLDNGKEFVWTSEQNGYNHVYLYDLKGGQPKQLTQGNWEVTNFYGVDEANGRIFYQAAKDGPLQRHVYSAKLKNGKDEERLTKAAGVNSAQFSSTFDYFVNTHSTLNTPPTYTVYDHRGKKVRTIEDNAALKAKMKEYQVQEAEFFTMKTPRGDELNGYMIKPKDFKRNREYPVLVTQYSGPGSQQVLDSYRGTNYFWYQMLAQRGFIVACVDPRGTGARGEQFKKQTYQALGKLETEDMIDFGRWLGKQSYVDEDRIGIFGWSYGGYMSSLAILKGNDVFKAAIAVAPVTNWKWYDTIYTERYMRTDGENPTGYRDNSPVYFADRLKGNYLLVHGMGDDNVHFQHTAEMANALVMANKQFDTYFYPNRNHGIYGGPTRLHLYTKMTNFLMDKLMLDERRLEEL